MAQEKVEGIPPIYQSAILKQIELLQRREFDLAAPIRYQFENLFLDYRDRLARYFAQHFVLSVNGDGHQVWDPVQAKALDTMAVLDESFDDTLDTLYDTIEPDLAEQSDEAEDEGYLLGLWMLSLGGLETTTTEAPSGIPPLLAGLGMAALLRQRFTGFQRRMHRTMRALVASGSTLPETLTFYDLLTTTFENAMVAWSRDHLYWSQLTGQEAAYAPFGSQLRGWLWYTREDERVCTQWCRPLHLRITTKVPIRDTHPRCRCMRVPIPRSPVLEFMQYEAFVAGRQAVVL